MRCRDSDQECASFSEIGMSARFEEVLQVQDVV